MNPIDLYSLWILNLWFAPMFFLGPTKKMHTEED